MHLTADFARCPGLKAYQESLSPTEQQRQLSNCKIANKMRRYLQRQLMQGLKKDRENWWFKVDEEMELATRKVADPYEVSSACFKLSEEALTKLLTSLLQDI